MPGKNLTRDEAAARASILTVESYAVRLDLTTGPEHFRTVFVLRQIQELSVEETAQCLDIKPETVKTRLHRARALLRRALFEQLDPVVSTALPFHAPRCDRVVAAVLARIGAGGNLS